MTANLAGTLLISRVLQDESDCWSTLADLIVLTCFCRSFVAAQRATQRVQRIFGLRRRPCCLSKLTLVPSKAPQIKSFWAGHRFHCSKRPLDAREETPSGAHQSKSVPFHELIACTQAGINKKPACNQEIQKHCFEQSFRQYSDVSRNNCNRRTRLDASCCRIQYAVQRV